MKRIYLTPGRERSIFGQHPWIFSGGIDLNRSDSPATGETVEVCNCHDIKLGIGWYSPKSKIAVRIIPEGTISDLVGSAVGRRADFFANAYTNAMRLINAESDGLPGVIADYYAGHVICQFTSAGAERNKREIVDALMTFAPFCKGVSERKDLKDREKEGLEMGGFEHIVGEAPPAEIEIVEGPCKFLVDVRNGHKTGFYLDQRDARMQVGSLANGLEVLNCFAYTGGFGLFARACGATKVTQVDISADALMLAKKNEALVHLCGTTMEYVEADVFQFLRKCRDEGKTFDMIVLDPPKFASSKANLMRAAKGYKDINLLAMKLLKPNGYLATFSCSGAMDEAFFNKVVAEAAVDAGMKFQILTKTRQAMDHPVALGFAEGLYLKGLILRRL